MAEVESDEAEDRRRRTNAMSHQAVLRAQVFKGLPTLNPIMHQHYNDALLDAAEGLVAAFDEWERQVLIAETKRDLHDAEAKVKQARTLLKRWEAN